MGNQMETISLKALALKVLERNSLGNHRETISEIDGNSQGKKEDKRKSEKGVNPDNLLTRSIEEFKSQNLAVRIRSKVLGEVIWLVSNENVRDHLKAEGLVCYLAEEILHLKELCPDDIRATHNVKKVFDKSLIVGRSLPRNGSEKDK